MALFLFIVLVAVPIVEIVIFIEVGGKIGLGPTLAVVVLTALLGTVLLRRQGLATLHSARESLENDRFPVAEVFDGLCLLVAGALLLTPGFFTDAVGFVLFVPPLRAVLRRHLIRILAERGHVRVDADAGPGAPRGAPGGTDGGTVIDGEYRDVTPDDGDGRPRLDGGGRGPPKPPDRP